MLLMHPLSLWQVLWAALFALAVLVREGSAPHSLALRSTAAAGILPLLQSCMAAYKVRTACPPPCSCAPILIALEACFVLQLCCSGLRVSEKQT